MSHVDQELVVGIIQISYGQEPDVDIKQMFTHTNACRYARACP